jgi:hypothetical protein
MKRKMPQAKTPKGYKRWEDVPAEMRLLLGTLAEREAEAKRQGVTETWETNSRRNWWPE